MAPIEVIEEIRKLVNIEQCLKDTNASSTYKHCHNACVWLIIQTKKASVPDHMVYLCHGTFWGKDHSWLIVEDYDGNYTVIDMTVDQFVDRSVPYVGPMTDEYHICSSINLCSDVNDIVNFVEKLGG